MSKALPFPLIILLASVAGLSSCTQEGDLTSRRSEVSEVITQLLVAYETEDIGLLSRIVVQNDNIIFFGTGASEHYSGWDSWKSSQTEKWGMDQKIRITSTDLKVFIPENGHIAWFTDVEHWHLIGEEDSINANRVRVSGILEKRRGTWKIVQIHFSIPDGTTTDKMQ